MSIISDLYSDIYEYHDEKAIKTYAEIISSGNTGCKKTADTPAPSVIDETSSAVTDTKNNTDSTENPLVMALFRKANDNQIAVCVAPERKPEPEQERPFRLKKQTDEEKIMASKEAIIAGLELLRQNELKAYQPVNVDMKMAERNSHHYKLSENAKEFCRFISATPEYANSCKQIHSHNKKKDIVTLLNFFKQNDEGNSFEFIHTTRFYRHLDYYVTKNSFFADGRKAENLFSFDNIMIDVDNHDEPALTTRELNKEICKLLSCLRAKELNFPEFSTVHSGRGVHIWIRLVSFSAIPDVMKRLYDIICRKLCDIVEKVIKENGINLEVDIPATVDASRLVRLPYTWNTKANRKATFEKCTDRRYGLTELCERLGIKRKSEDKKKDNPQSGLKPREWTANTPLLYKRTAFIMELAKLSNGYCNGRRNSMLYLYYNYCLQLHDFNTAQIKLQQLNNSFKEPVKQSQINTIFREFEQKSQTNDPFYKYSKAKFLDELKLTVSERLMYTNFMSREAERTEAREAKEKRNQTIVTMWEQGCTQQQIADEVGCHVDTVANVLKKYKPEINQETAENTDNTKKPKLIKPVRKDVEKLTIELYKQSYKQKDIAKKLGIAESTVSEILKSFKKVELSPRDLEIIQLYKQGLSKAEIAKQVGCSRPTVYSVLKAYNDNTVTEPKPDKTVVPAPAEEKPTPEDFFRRIEKIQRERIERMLNAPIDKMFELEPETVRLPKGFTDFKK